MGSLGFRVQARPWCLGQWFSCLAFLVTTILGEFQQTAAPNSIPWPMLSPRIRPRLPNAGAAFLRLGVAEDEHPLRLSGRGGLPQTRSHRLCLTLEPSAWVLPIGSLVVPFLGLPYRILNLIRNKELLRSRWVKPKPLIPRSPKPVPLAHYRGQIVATSIQFSDPDILTI